MGLIQGGGLLPASASEPNPAEFASDMAIETAICTVCSSPAAAVFRAASYSLAALG